MAKSTRAQKAVCMDLGRDFAIDLTNDLRAALGHCSWSLTEPTAEGYLLDNVLSKYPNGTDSNDTDSRRSLAISKLLTADAKCETLNEMDFQTGHMDLSVLNGLLKSAQTLIGNLVTGFSHSLQNHGMHSNGASVGFKLQDAAIFKKFADKGTVTPRAYDAAVLMVKLHPHWYTYMTETYGDETSWFRRVPGNSVFTVPKNAKIDRAAAKEPSMNMYLQKSVGQFFRTRLRSVGIDLNDQTRNQELAKRASADGSLATIDLSAASDSISDRLVWELLPPQLYSYLDMIRSHRAVMPDGTCHTWSLFSTMGNGFTFELESMLFWALAKACCLHSGVAGDIGIYGDDIVIPVECAPLLIDTLTALGFKTNDDKTFINGPFRESCGGHFLNGIDIKPFFIRRELNTLTTLMLTLNRIRGWGVINGISDPRLFDVWTKYTKYVPQELWGGCDCNRDDYLVTPHYPRKRIKRVTKNRDAFAGRFTSNEENGRYITWHHLGAGDISESKSTNQFAVMANKEWSTDVPTFPQEVGVC